VGQLLVWQKQYQVALEVTAARLSEATESMKQASTDYGNLVQKSGVFTNVAVELSAMLRTLSDDRARLQTVSTELAKLLTSAQGSLPQIEQEFLALTQQLTNSVDENQRMVAGALSDNATAIRNSIQTTNDALAASHKQNSARITELVDKTKQQVAVLDKALSEEL
jgi:chromosome segregation ATPase